MASYNFTTVPNQKVITINKEPCDKNHLYTTINLQALSLASQKLDAEAFKLWIYFAKNQDKYQFALSFQDVSDNCKMKRTQYDNAIHSLIEGGYLERIIGNKYIFYEEPRVNET